MSNYLKTLEFQDVETMYKVLFAAKLALEPDVWKKATNESWIDDGEFVLWTESENYRPVEYLWNYVVNDFPWCDVEDEMEEPEESVIDMPIYGDEACNEHSTTSRVDHLVTMPDLEFEHELYSGNINTFLSSYKGEAA